MQGLVATQMIEEGSLDKVNKLEKNGVILQLLERELDAKQKARREIPVAI